MAASLVLYLRTSDTKLMSRRRKMASDTPRVTVWTPRATPTELEILTVTRLVVDLESILGMPAVTKSSTMSLLEKSPLLRYTGPEMNTAPVVLLMENN